MPASSCLLAPCLLVCLLASSLQCLPTTVREKLPSCFGWLPPLSFPNFPCFFPAHRLGSRNKKILGVVLNCSNLGYFHFLRVLSIASFFRLKVVADKIYPNFCNLEISRWSAFLLQIRKEKIGQTTQIKCHSESKVFIPFAKFKIYS